jgi:ascorbate-specific PTS system EIIC-type component UlaA
MNKRNLRNMLTNERRNEVAALLTVLFCLGYAALLTSKMARTVVEYTLVGIIGVMVVWFVYSLMRATLEQLGKNK